MIIDLLSYNNYLNFNVKLAHILGLHHAIYIAELLAINDKAIKKKKIEENFFNIDRKYIQSRTTLDESEQIEIEKDLMNIGVLEPYGKNDCNICLNITTLTTILTNPDETFVKDIKKVVKKKSNARKTKAEKIIEALKEKVECTNEELREAYFEWIETVYAKQGWMSAKSVTQGQKQVDEFSNRDLDVALKLLEIATLNGYRDIEWAINKYKANYTIHFSPKPSISNQQKSVELSEEVF